MNVSVIMSVYNGENYVWEAVNSILKQTYKDFEFIIIDDFSSDRTVEIIQNMSDERIRLYINNENCGLTKNLNYGISIAKGNYIARMDADDISHVERLEKQVEFFNQNPEIGVLGTNAKEFGDSNNTIIWPATHDNIKTTMLINNPIVHSSVMIRSSILKQNQYNNSFRTAQDYELWTRLIWQTKFANLQEVLIKYRIHKNQVTVKKEINQNKIANIARLRMLDKLIVLKSESENIFLKSCISDPDFTFADIIELKRIYKDIVTINQELNVYINSFLISQLSKNLDRILYTYTRRNFNSYNLKLLSGLSSEFNKFKIRKYLGPIYGQLVKLKSR